ncbi:MAG: UdgX family uracil-DNA binding protein [Lautropia sp.]
MQPRTLFDDATLPQGHAVARIAPSFVSWQREARRLLRERRAPDAVHWQADVPLPVGGPQVDPVRLDVPRACDGVDPAIRVPRAFVELARTASCHSDPNRFALLYRVLWRLSGHEPRLLQDPADADVIRLERWAKAVRRDAHKMKAFVRFRAMPTDDDDARYVAWFEPEHHIVDDTAGFFQRRFATMRWSILTPTRCAHWEGRQHDAQAWFSPGVSRDAAPAGDRVEDAWLRYYRSVFNPARLKPAAMRAEMPMKYWKNLPEARAIPSMIDEAPRRVAAMVAARKTADVPALGAVPPTPDERQAAAIAGSAPATLERLAIEARRCRRCPLWEHATQTVFGEGPADAALMLVGEQPGDREDLAGRPFVGPAGSLLRQALIEAGLDVDALYLTNAVKHFRFRVSGKRRLHAKPRDGEIDACAPWLDAEIERVAPSLIVCLGATAARAVLGGAVKVGEIRGRPIEARGRQVLVTVHPSYLLRLPQADMAREERRRFVGELAIATRWVEARARADDRRTSDQDRLG